MSKRLIVGVTGAGVMLALLTFAIRADASPAVDITATIQNGSNANITGALIGTGVHAAVSVASSTGPLPTGTVDFNRYQNTTCSGTATVEAGVALSSGLAQSATTTVPNTGLSYIVHYSGNGTYPAGDTSCQALTASSTSVTITTNLSTSTAVYAGSSIYDTSTLSGATSNASGAVTYKVYTNNSCNAGEMSAGSGNVVNGIVGNSNSIQFNTPGTYYWQAVYGGDSQNNIATSTCGSEVLTVIATSSPAVNTAPTITLLGANPFYLTVGQTFNDPGATSTDAQEGSLTYKIIKTGVVNTAVVGTTTLTYSVHDSGNLGATTTRTVIVNATSTNPGTGVISGNSYNDVNKNRVADSGEVGLSGWTVKLYKGSGWKKNPIQTTTTDANGHYSFSNLPDGTYSVEQIITKGWSQISPDFRKVVITNGSSKTDANFYDVKKQEVKGRDHKFLKRWVKFWNNGNHYGWFKDGKDGDNDED